VSAPSSSLIGLIADAFSERGVDLARLGMAWARATPAVTLVPAFGLKALPGAARVVLAVALAAAVFPALPAVPPLSTSIWVGLLEQVLAGVPVAIAAAVPLWAATMAGGLADALRGSSDTITAPTVEGGATPLGVTMSLLASGLFFATGGPARVALALLSSGRELHPVLRASEDIANGITVAVALGAPLLAASIVVEVAGALVARAAAPAQLHLLLAPLRSLVLLTVFALVFRGLSEALGAVVAHARI
jgi:type III secretory pathway component EscT